jgi:hypothetical protein
LSISGWVQFIRFIGSGFMVGLVLAFSDTRKEVPHSLKKEKRKTQKQCHLQLEHINVDTVEKGRKKEKNVN